MILLRNIKQDTSVPFWILIFESKRKNVTSMLRTNLDFWIHKWRKSVLCYTVELSVWDSLENRIEDENLFLIWFEYWDSLENRQ
jgi:hypothetical protein